MSLYIRVCNKDFICFFFHYTLAALFRSVNARVQNDSLAPIQRHCTNTSSYTSSLYTHINTITHTQPHTRAHTIPINIITLSRWPFGAFRLILPKITFLVALSCFWHAGISTLKHLCVRCGPTSTNSLFNIPIKQKTQTHQVIFVRKK